MLLQKPGSSSRTGIPVTGVKTVLLPDAMSYKQDPLRVCTTLGERGPRHRTLISHYVVVNIICKVFSHFLMCFYNMTP